MATNTTIKLRFDVRYDEKVHMKICSEVSSDSKKLTDDEAKATICYAISELFEQMTGVNPINMLREQEELLNIIHSK